MDLVSLTFGAPLLPLRGLVWIAELIQEQVELELRNPASVRRQLEQIEEARAAGLISEEEENLAMEQALGRLTAARPIRAGELVGRREERR